MNWKKLFSEAAVLVIAAVGIGAGANAFRPEARKLAWVADYQTLGRESRLPAASAPAGSADDLLALAPPKDPGLLFLEISGEAALRLQHAGALFIDARRSSAYEQGHIEKALNIPVWEHDADDRIAALLGKGWRPDAVIVTYCSGGGCEDAARLSGKLAQAGFFNIYLYKDGFPGWKSHGWPVTAGKQP